LPLVDAVTRAEEAVAKLMCLSETQVGITFVDVSQLMGITVKRLKRVKRRDGWRLLRPHRGNEPAEWSILDVIASAKRRVSDLKYQQKRK